MIKLPEWATQNENYTPKAERENFIARSLLNVLSILRELRFQSRIDKPKNFSPAGAVLFTIILIMLCAASHEKIFLLSIAAIELIFLCTLDGKIILRILKKSLLAALFSCVFVLPAIFFLNSALAIFLPIKTFLTVTALALLTNFFSWHSLTGTLAFFRLPAVIIFILDTTLRQIFLLGEISRDLLTALKIRSIGKSSQKEKQLSGIIGNVFLKSGEVSEEMYFAMRCRCFTGEYFTVGEKKFLRGDFILLFAAIFFVALFIIAKGSAK